MGKKPTAAYEYRERIRSYVRMWRLVFVRWNEVYDGSYDDELRLSDVVGRSLCDRCVDVVSFNIKTKICVM